MPEARWPIIAPSAVTQITFKDMAVASAANITSGSSVTYYSDQLTETF